jgi:Ala-tRNA(Pro) deacylase
VILPPVVDRRTVEAVMSDQTGQAAVTEFLERKGIPYEVVEHERRESAAAEARAAGVPPSDFAKTVVVRDEGGVRLAVIPASERLDMHKLTDELGSKGLRLLTEREMAEEFDDFELGAIPPFGPILHALELVDHRLLDHERIMCSGGDHEHGVLLDPHDLVRATQARVADICEN